MIPGTASARGIKHPPVSGRPYVFQVTPPWPTTLMSLDEATLALISEIDQVHRSAQPQDTFKYVNSLMSLGRHLQLQEFRSWLNHKCGLPVAVRPSDVDLKEYMEKDQIEAWIHEWTQQHATDRSGKMLSLFPQHEFQVDVKDTMKPCNGCDQAYSTFLLMPMRAYKEGTYDPSDYHLFCYTCCTSTSGLLSPGHWLREHPEHQAHQRLLAMTPAPSNLSWRECELRALEATNVVLGCTTTTGPNTRPGHHPAHLG